MMLRCFHASLTRAIVVSLFPTLCLFMHSCGPESGSVFQQPSRSPQHRSHRSGDFRVQPPRQTEEDLILQDVWPPRAVWVVREVYDSPLQIADLMEQIEQTGLNTVLWQVRARGTAFYRSSIEPFAYAYPKGDPGFDPLMVACEEAHARGLAIHAWVNMMPGWSGIKPPNDPNQLYNARPEWFLRDQRGRRQPLAEFYVSLNPCLPEVREYLVNICEEIVTQYPVDGLHMDYIRFPIEKSPRGSDYPYDPRTLSLYKAATGKHPSLSRSRWTQYRIDQVTQLVRDVRAMMRRRRPDAKLTAACAPDIKEARERFFQDGSAWLRGNLVDLVFVMNYTRFHRAFKSRHEAWERASQGAPVAPGIGVYLHRESRETTAQLAMADRWGEGFSLFSATTLFEHTASSRQRLASIRPMIRRMEAEAQARAEAADMPMDVEIGVTGSIGVSSGSSNNRRRVLVP